MVIERRDLAAHEWVEPLSSAWQLHGTAACAECVGQSKGRRDRKRSGRIQIAVRCVVKMKVEDFEAEVVVQQAREQQSLGVAIAAAAAAAVVGEEA
jgi:hypothetical protein